jgi:hypothetical protein
MAGQRCQQELKLEPAEIETRVRVAGHGQRNDAGIERSKTGRTKVRLR